MKEMKRVTVFFVLLLSCFAIISCGQTNDVHRLTQAAEQGDADAQYKLGMCYLSGLGVAQDSAEAAKWLRKAAEQGDAYVQFNLGMCYYNGLGVPQDYAEAAKWWRKAAEQGDADAQSRLGECYHYGEGVAQDYAEAAYWFHKAAEQGDADGQYRLADLYYYKFYQQDKAVKLYKAAARQGHKEAQKTLITLGEEW